MNPKYDMTLVCFLRGRTSDSLQDQGAFRPANPRQICFKIRLPMDESRRVESKLPSDFGHGVADNGTNMGLNVLSKIQSIVAELRGEELLQDGIK